MSALLCVARSSCSDQGDATNGHEYVRTGVEGGPYATRRGSQLLLYEFDPSDIVEDAETKYLNMSGCRKVSC